MKYIRMIIVVFILMLIGGMVGNVLRQCYLEKKAFEAAQILCSTFNSTEAIEAERFFQENADLYIPALIKIAKDEDQEVGTRTTALLHIGVNRDIIAVAPLCELLSCNDWQIRFFAAQALGKIQDKEATERLSQAWLNEESKKVRYEIAIALAKIGDKRAIPALLETYKSDDRYIQILSAVVLYKLSGDDHYLDLITKAVTHEECKIRVMVIYILGQIGDKEMIPLIEQALDDKDSRIREMAQMSIEAIESEAKNRKILGSDLEM
jgi:HEAT repeat protein